MNIKPISLFLLLLYLISGPSGLAQNIVIDYINPSGDEGLIVCDSALFELTLTNTSTDNAINVTLNLQFPDFVSYLPGSVVNATESNISNLNAPVFEVTDMVPSEVVDIQFFAKAECELIEAINNMQLFANTIQVDYDNGSNTITTTPYLIETPLLVMTNSTGLIQNGQQGDMLTRSFTITNSRLGPLSSFTFRDSHGGGIEISTDLGTDISTQANVYEALLGPADFATIGDGDGLFELDESITITEQILITSCGFPQTSTVSDIQAQWGCSGAICQSTFSVQGYIGMDYIILEPELSFTPIPHETPLCFCDGQPVQQGLLIENNSPHAATNIGLEISQYFGIAAMYPASFTIDSSGVTNEFVAMPDTALNYDAPCITPGTVFKYVAGVIPILEPGHSLTLYWDVYYCSPACNSNKTTRWGYIANYFSSCPPEPQIVDMGNIVVPFFGMSDSLITNAPDLLTDDEYLTFDHFLLSDWLLEPSQQMSITIEIPCGLEWVTDNDLLLSGQSPQNIDITTTEFTTTIVAEYTPPFSGDSLHLQFDLFFDCDSICSEVLCEDSVITSCTELCTTFSPPGLYVDITSSLQMEEDCPYECNLNTCTRMSLPVDCELPLCIDTIPGYAEYSFSVLRTNFGLPDNNDDRIADPGGNIDLNLIRRDRLIAGDTFEVAIDAVVVMDQLNHSFQGGRISIPISAGVFNINTNEDLFEEGGMLPVGQQLVIFDNDANTWYDCGLAMPLTINTPATTGAFSFEYDISPTVLTGGCALPVGFAYSDGDSILFKQMVKINYNINSPGGASTPPIADLIFKPQVFLFDEEDIPEEEWFHCTCPSTNLELSGYKYNIALGIHAIPPCEPSAFVGGTLFSFLLGEGNFFPYEHRALGQLSGWQQEIPPGFSIVGCKLTVLELQDGGVLHSNEPLPFTTNGNLYDFDLLPFQVPVPDEGFSILIQHQYETDCSQTGTHPMTVHAEISPAENLVLPETIDTTVIKTASLRMLIPELELEAIFFDNTSYTNQGQWDFTIHNMPSSVASFTSGPAENAWLYPESTTGLLTDFVLTDASTGMVFPNINGVFQLGTLQPNDTLDLVLTALNSSCQQEEVVVRYGWHCSLYDNPILTPCYQRQAAFTVVSPPAALEQTVESPAGPHFLCDTISYYTIEVFNADLGSAYNLVVEAQLPPGLHVLPGSSEIAYPTGSSYTMVGDPVETGNGTWVWNISALQDSIGQNGLPGFLSNPNHSFQLRFACYTDCDFIASSFPIFFAEAEQICGEHTNTLAEAGESILIEGLPPPYTAAISAVLEVPVIGCEDSITLSVNIIADANTNNGDSLFVTLPVGVNYVSNSIVGNGNAVVQEPSISTTGSIQTLKWPLLAGLPPNTEIGLTFLISGFSELDCGNPLLLLQTVGPTSALCTANNMECDILVETGNNLVTLSIDRASFALSDFMLDITPAPGNLEQFNYNIAVTNSSTESTPPLLLDLYWDADNSGTWSAADVWIQTDSFNNSLATGETITLSGNFLTDQGAGCQLLAVIDQAKHCACEGDVLPINADIQYTFPEAIPLCSGQDGVIGVDFVPGTTYQWTPTVGLSCGTCPLADVLLYNTSNTDTTYIYTLTASDAQGCVVTYEYSINLLPQPGIANATNTICPGDSILLTATAASSYYWEGPGILDPELPEQWVAPADASLYTVLLTDALGCTGQDSITIQIAEPPFAFAGNDTLVCDNTVVQLTAWFDDDYSYQWEPTGLLDDPASANPTLLNNISTFFDLTVTDGMGCQSTDQVFVDFQAAPLLVGPEEVFLCQGDSVLIEFGGATHWQWSPSVGLSCDTCATVIAYPNSPTTYLVVGTDTLGCSTSANVAVQLWMEQVVEEDLSLCEGETVVIFGEEVSTAGLYCDTLVSAVSGCDSLYCVEVSLDPRAETEEAQSICEGESVEFNGVAYTEGGIYCVDLQTAAGCDSMHCLVLEVRAAPNIDVPPEISIPLGDTVAFDFPDAYSYEWSPEEGLSCSDCADPVAFPEEDTEYEVTVTDSLGCSRVLVVVVRTVPPDCGPPGVFIPNAFTPNGDGENDVLRVYGSAIERLHLVVYNRWGQKVFETYDKDGSWDGRFNGQLLHPDVFGFALEVDCVGGTSYFHKGNVTILR